MRLTLLGSGSSGNVALVESGDGAAPTRILVDAGLPKSAIERRLSMVAGAASLNLSHITAVLITHDHSDHAGSAASLGRPIYATATVERNCALQEVDVVRVVPGEKFSVGPIEVSPVLLPHDAEETIGYIFSDAESKVGILTDCGYDSAEVAAAFAGCDVLALETNYDQTMLQAGPYPPTLKRRVGGSRGHLSNDQAASLLKLICKAGPAPKLVIAAHLSQLNNRPALAKSALEKTLRGLGARVEVATQPRPTPTFTAASGQVQIQPLPGSQLSLFAPPLARLRS